MPVISQQPPSIEVKETLGGKETPSLMSQSPLTTEDSVENINREKLANIKKMMRTYVDGALREKDQGDLTKYNELVSLLMTDPSSEEAPPLVKLYTWVIVLSESVSCLDKTCAALVDALLHIDWAPRDNTFVSAYMKFLEHLVSAQSFYAGAVVDSLIGGLHYRIRLPSYAKVSRSAVYDRVHEALRSILRVSPTAANPLYQSIVRRVPHLRHNSAVQATYISNVLRVLEYTPFLQRQILALCIQQMVKIDSHIQIELDELEEDVDFETYDVSFDGDYESDASDDETDDENNFSDDEFDEEEDDDEPVEKKTSESRQVRLIKSMVRKLDAMMVLVLRYLSNYAITANRDERNDMYNTLLTLFDQQIVMTLKSRYTQFLLFYFSSLEVNVFPDRFIEHLFDSMNDTSRPGIIRIACAAYISSYVARAKVLDSDGVQKTMNTLCNWCYAYLDQVDDTMLRPDPIKHDMFYAVMQAIMYIFCFRWRDLVMQENDFDAQEEDDEESQSNAPENDALDKVPMIVIGNGTRKWCRGLRNIGVLLQSKLNPLKVCSPMVVQQFAKIASETDLVYVHAMLENNKNVYISGVTAGASDGSRGKHILATVQSFFPFDPYNLKSSQHFIHDIYFEWIADDDDDDEDDSSDDENESDEEEQAMEQGLSAMSISPVAPQFMSLS